jgi:hypothetical protein
MTIFLRQKAENYRRFVQKLQKTLDSCRCALYPALRSKSWLLPGPVESDAAHDAPRSFRAYDARPAKPLDQPVATRSHDRPARAR